MEMTELVSDEEEGSKEDKNERSQMGEMNLAGV